MRDRETFTFKNDVFDSVKVRKIFKELKSLFSSSFFFTKIITERLPTRKANLQGILDIPNVDEIIQIK